MATINNVVMSDAAAANLEAWGLGERDVEADLIKLRSGMRHERLLASYCGGAHTRPREINGWRDYVAALVAAAQAEGPRTRRTPAPIPPPTEDMWAAHEENVHRINQLGDYSHAVSRQG